RGGAPCAGGARCRDWRTRRREPLRWVAAADAAAQPRLSEQYGAEVWERIRRELPAARDVRSARPRASGFQTMWQMPRWAWAGAAAAVLVAAFFGGRWFERGRGPVTVAPTNNPAIT